MTHMLELKELHYYYGKIEAVKGISLHVDPGEIVALIGANGAGKTTTLRCVSAGLLPYRRHRVPGAGHQPQNGP